MIVMRQEDFDAAFKAVMAFSLLLLTACAWTPRSMSYPSGLKIVLGDRYMLDSICSHTDDKGERFGPGDYAAGCYDSQNDIIYLLDSCLGAEALTHELGHREGLADPEAAGLNW